jgi:hypothetical protein
MCFHSQYSLGCFRTLAEIEIDRCRIRALEALDTALALELEKPYTQNLDYSRLRKQWLHRYRTAHRGSADGNVIPAVKSAFVGLSGMHNIANLLEFMDDLLGFPDTPEAELDAEEEELMVMAEVRAYFHVAYKVCWIIHQYLLPILNYDYASQRFIDHIPMTIEHSLSQALAKDLRELFQLAQHDLNLDPERMELLLRGDPDVPMKKERFETRRRRLMEVKQKLDEFRQD